MDRTLMSLLDTLKYKLLRLEFFLRMNTGSDEHNGWQFFGLHIVPVKNVKSYYTLNQHYGTRNIWKLGRFFIVIA